jgi:hypothetical protein
MLLAAFAPATLARLSVMTCQRRARYRSASFRGGGCGRAIPTYKTVQGRGLLRRG